MEVEEVNKLGIERGEEGENRESAKKEDPPNSLKREEVKNNNDLGRRSPWWGGGRKEPATNIITLLEPVLGGVSSPSEVASPV